MQNERCGETKSFEKDSGGRLYKSSAGCGLQRFQMIDFKGPTWKKITKNKEGAYSLVASLLI